MREDTLFLKGFIEEMNLESKRFLEIGVGNAEVVDEVRYVVDGEVVGTGDSATYTRRCAVDTRMNRNNHYQPFHGEA